MKVYTVAFMGGPLAGVTAEFVASVWSIALEPLPRDVERIATCCILDWIGVALAGANEPLVAMLLAEIEPGANGSCTIVGHAEHASPYNAALLNGAAGDALDFSDTNRAMHGHATATVFPAALAAAEVRGYTGRHVVRAFVLGVEAACRIGRLLSDGMLETPFHPTPVCGVIGAAAAAAALNGLGVSRALSALGIAATQASGLAEASGTMCKPLHAGMSAAAGLLAARLAARGFTAPLRVLEPERGFVRAHTARAVPNAIDASRGAFFIRQTLLKEHAACALAHGSIENVLRLKREHAFNPADIERVTVRIAESSARVCGIAEPRSPLEARFSIGTLVAMAILGRDTGDPASLSETMLASPEMAAIRARVITEGKPGIDVERSELELTLRDGRVLAARTDERDRVADPFKAAATAELDRRCERAVRKFRALAGRVVGGAAAGEIERLVFALETQDSLHSLTRLLSPQAAHV